MAPEVLRGEEYDQSVDWWALATMVYEMVDGLPPFWAEEQATMLDAIALADLDGKFPPGRFTPDCELFLRAVLQVEAGVRLGAGPQSTEAIKAHPWFLGTDWRAVYRRELVPPFVPSVRDEYDLRYFDQSFLDEDPEAEFQASLRRHRAEDAPVAADLFEDFSFEEVRSPRAPETSPPKRRIKASNVGHKDKDPDKKEKRKEEKEKRKGKVGEGKKKKSKSKAPSQEEADRRPGSTPHLRARSQDERHPPHSSGEGDPLSASTPIPSPAPLDRR